MNIRNFPAIFVLSLAASGLACSGDDSSSDSATTTSATATTTSSTSSSTSETTGDPSTSTSSSTSASTSTSTSTTDPTATTTTTGDPTTTTGGAELTCDYYCSVYLDACGDYTEYDNVDACVAQCNQWPEGDLNATDGDSLGCRIYHATVAGSSDPAVHCPHAGPNGADVCVDPNAPDCANYCKVYLQNCTGDNDVYLGDESACLAACEEWYPGTADDASGDTVGCRTYHSGAALGDPMLHCPHASPSGGGVCVAG